MRQRSRSREWFRTFFDADAVAMLRDEKPARQTRAEVDFVVRSLRLAPGARILDVPCGYGRHAAVNLYTSFGYFSPRENEAVLRRMARALRPGGRILIDHRDPGFDATLPGRLWFAAGPRRFALEERRFDRRTGITESTWLIVVAGKSRVARKAVRLQEFSLPQWRRLFRRAGLRLLRAYSGYDGRPYRTVSARRLIVVGERLAGR